MTWSKWESTLCSFARAGHFNQQATPARRVAALYLDRFGGRPAPTQHPRCQPLLDFRGEVPQEVAARQVYPDARLVVGWWSGNDDQLIAGLYPGEVLGALAEDCAVYG